MRPGCAEEEEDGAQPSPHSAPASMKEPGKQAAVTLPALAVGDVLLEKGNFSLSEENTFSPLTAGLASPPPLQMQLLAESSAGGREKPWTRDDCQFALISRERFRVTEKHTKVAFKHRQLYTQHAPQQGLAPTDFR